MKNMKALCIVLLSVLLAVSSTACRGGDSGGGQISIGSVSSTSPMPLTPLALATNGIAASQPVSATFFNSAGFSDNGTPIRVETDGTVVVAVPLYVDPSTGTVTNGTVSLVLSQGRKVSAPVTLYIQDLPTLDTYGVKLGEVSDAFLSFRSLLLGRRIGQLQAASLLFGIDTSELQSALSNDLEAVLLAQSEVERVMADNSTVVTNGSLPSGSQIQSDKDYQDMMDRVIAVYLLRQFGNDTSSLANIASRMPSTSCSALASASRLPITSGMMANLGEIIDVLDDARVLPNFVRDMQTSESGLDFAVAVLTAGSAYIPDSDAIPGESQLARKLGAGFGLLGIGRAAVDVSYDLGSLYVNNDPATMENLARDRVKLLDASVSALTLGFVEGVKAGTTGSMDFFGMGLALRDVEMFKSAFCIKEEETAKFVAFKWADSPSPNRSFGRITGTAPGQSSIDLCCLGASALGIQGIADPSGYYEMFVPRGVSGTDYTNLTLSARDPISGSTWDSETVDLSGLDTSQPLQVSPLMQDMSTPTVEQWTATFSGTFVYNPSHDTFEYSNEPFSFNIRDGVLEHEGATATIGTSGQVTFGSIYNNWVFTGTIDEDAGTASGTWTLHIPGQWGQAGDGNGTWSANRVRTMSWDSVIGRWVEMDNG